MRRTVAGPITYTLDEPLQQALVHVEKNQAEPACKQIIEAAIAPAMNDDQAVQRSRTGRAI